MSFTRVISKLAIALAMGLCFTTPAVAQQRQSGISTRIPVVDMVFDERAGTVRSISGGTGYSVLSEPLDFGFRFKQIAVARRNGFALAITEDTKEVVILDFRQASSAQGIAHVAPGADSVVLSSTGVSAAIYYPEAAVVEVLRGLPDNVVRTGRITLQPGQPLRALIVSDDATAILAAVDSGASDSVVFMSVGGASQSLFATVGRALVSFLNNSRDSMIVDQGTGDVLLFRDPQVSAQAISFSGIRESIGVPVATGVSYDNAHAFFASADPGMIAKVELSTGSIAVTNCACNPDGLWPLDRNGLFRLSRFSDGPLWVFDATQAEAQTYVLPLDIGASPLETGERLVQRQ